MNKSLSQRVLIGVLLLLLVAFSVASFWQWQLITSSDNSAPEQVLPEETLEDVEDTEIVIQLHEDFNFVPENSVIDIS